MSTHIFYFSGTGNSLFAARQLGALLSDQVSIIPMKRLQENQEVKTNADCVIFVCPVYFQTLPHIVRSFIKKLKLEAPDIPIYGVVTCNGGPGHSLYTMDKMLKKKGRSLRSGFTVTMPGNSLIIRDFTNPPEIRAERLEESGLRLTEISEHINHKHSGIMEGQNYFKYHLQGFLTGSVAQYIYKTPSRFRTTSQCMKCGTCIRVCPTGNIKMGKQGIEWGSSCEHCLACFHWCPGMAVEIGNGTKGKLRYHHPDISINDMLNDQKG